jgi:TetR/AcrR family tetracycline transcriptional repressor
MLKEMGRPAVISRESVAAVALRLLDDEGVDALSIERIATELGVRGPSLYHHFADKSEILSEVARLVLGDLDLDRPTDDWKEWMVEATLTFFRRVLEHPSSAAILLEHMPDASTVPGFGRAARLLTQAGIEPEAQVLLLEGSEKIAWGWALQRAVTATRTEQRMSPSRINRRWPELAVAVRDSCWTDEELVEASIRAFIDGVVGPGAGRLGSASAPAPADGRAATGRTGSRGRGQRVGRSA